MALPSDRPLPPFDPGRIAYAPPPPPPPPGWVAWTGPPLRGGPGGPSRTIDGVASIRKGLGHYRVVVALTLVLALVSAALVAVLGSPGVVVGSSFGGALAIAAISGIAGLLALILTIVSWVEWRSGLRTLLATARERGEPYRRDVEAAQRFYTGTVVAWILNVVSVALVAVAILALAFASVRLAGSNASAPTIPATVGLPGGHAIQALLFGEVVVTAVLNLILFYCAGRSLQASVRALIGEPERERLESARVWIVVGAVVGPIVSIALFYSVWAAAGLVVMPLLLLFGYTQIIGVYDRALESAVVPTPATVGPTYGF
ncbi:MAG TPA: hypothetical protein VIZ68_03270 [Thermoplasmata archaeon]